MNNKTKLIGGAIVIAAVFFYGGYAFAGMGKGKVSAARMGGFGATAGANVTGRGGATGGPRNVMTGGFTTGSVIAKDAESITVKLQDGSSRIVFMSTSTPVMRTVTGTSNDLSVGTNVMVTGSQNSDGSLTAQSIQVRPAGMGVGTTTRAR